MKIREGLDHLELISEAIRLGYYEQPLYACQRPVKQLKEAAIPMTDYALPALNESLLCETRAALPKPGGKVPSLDEVLAGLKELVF